MLRTIRARASRAIDWHLVHGRFGRLVREAVLRHPYFHGGGVDRPRDRVIIGEHVMLTDTIFNVASGDIVIGDHTSIAYGVSLLASTHDLTKTREARQWAVPPTGCDIRIGRGVFIGTGATIVGPCTVGDDAIIAAGAVVVNDVPKDALVAGVPARVVRVVHQALS